MLPQFTASLRDQGAAGTMTSLDMFLGVMCLFTLLIVWIWTTKND